MTAQYLRTHAKRAARTYTPPAARDLIQVGVYALDAA